MERVTVHVKVAPHARDIGLPEYMSESCSGMDLRAAIAEPLLLGPGDRVLVPTGIHLEIPPGYEGQVRPRSGLALDFGVTTLNSPGTIDSDYRGEIKVLLVNLGTDPVQINRGDRIAQLVIAPIARATLKEMNGLSPTARNGGGFGHTGR